MKKKYYHVTPESAEYGKIIHLFDNDVRKFKTEYMEVDFGIREIEKFAFEGFINLKELILPNSTRCIGSYTFKDCEKLEMIVLPQILTEIPMGAFYNCKSLKEINLPKTVNKIGAEAFKNCQNLSVINLSEEIYAIGSKAFFGCNSLTKVAISVKFKDKIDDIFENYKEIIEEGNRIIIKF